MKKEIMKFEINFPFDWDNNVKIKQLKEDLDILEKQGVTDIQFEIKENTDECFIEIKAFVKRIETDEEFNIRVNEFNKRQEVIRQRELEQLKNLKLKYEKV